MEATNDTRMLGQQIRAKRKECGLTQSEVAAVAGCSQRFVSELERGKRTAELGKALAVVRALGCQLGLQPCKVKPYAMRRLEDYL